MQVFLELQKNMHILLQCMGRGCGFTKNDKNLIPCALLNYLYHVLAIVYVHVLCLVKLAN